MKHGNKSVCRHIFRSGYFKFNQIRKIAFRVYVVAAAYYHIDIARCVYRRDEVGDLGRCFDRPVYGYFRNVNALACKLGGEVGL